MEDGRHRHVGRAPDALYDGRAHVGAVDDVNDDAIHAVADRHEALAQRRPDPALPGRAVDFVGII